MAQTVAFALIGALYPFPYLCPYDEWGLLKENQTKKHFRPHDGKIEGVYQRMLRKALVFPSLLSPRHCLVLLLLWSSFRIGEFIPALEEGDFAVTPGCLPEATLMFP